MVLAVAVVIGATVAAVAVATPAFATGGWSSPSTIDASGGGLGDVSCASPTFCVAVDLDGNVLTYDGTSWSGPTSIDSGNALNWVSCPSVGFCAAVDSDGNVLTYDGTSWSPTSVNPGVNLESVSCTSSAFCAVVGDDGNAFTFDGTNWSGPTAIDPGTIVWSVSCLPTMSSTFCMAVASGGEAFTYDGTGWSGGTDADAANNLYAVSCAATDFCVAGDWNGQAVMYDGTNWSSAGTVDPSYNVVNSISCASTTFCAAVVNDGDGYIYDGTTWTGPPTIDSGNNAWAVSCPTTSFCAAVDLSGNALIYTSSTLQITTANTLPSATPNARYSVSLTASGGNPPYTWKLVKGSGKLPKGLKLKGATISGKPSTTDRGVYTFSVEVLDKKTATKPHIQHDDVRTFSLAVSSAHITSVTFTGSVDDPGVVVTGTGFAAAPPKVDAQCGDSGYDYNNDVLYINDVSAAWYAGQPIDCVGLDVSTYTSTRIVYSFGNGYSANGWDLNAGDQYVVGAVGASLSGTIEYP